MKNLFKGYSLAFIEKYPDCPEPLALRVYTSRLISADTRLVLHGGGNTSVKLSLKNIVGEEEEVIFVKGSGWDMAAIEPEGFTGLRLSPLRKLRSLDFLSDEEMDNFLKINRISAYSPDPSVEALLHAFLPHKYVDHTHADSILVLTNQKHGEDRAKEALGPEIAVIPYTRSGLPLARAVVEAYERNPETEGIVVMNHGIFTFAEDAESAYGKMIAYVSRADAYIEDRIKDKPLATSKVVPSPADSESALTRCAQFIRGICAQADVEGKPRRLHLNIRNTPDLVAASLSEEAPDICRSGVLTPDHAIRTKNAMAYIESVPESDDELKGVVNRAVETFAADYQKYFHKYAVGKGIDQSALNPAPVLFFVAGLGLMALGPTRKAARIAADIAEHTVWAKHRASAMGEYLPISDEHVFDMEYWPMQRKKLDRSESPPLKGQVALITGAGGAIGFGIAKQLLNAGAAVAISDFNKARLENVHTILTAEHDPDLVKPVIFDVTDYKAVERAFKEISLAFGGIDIVVPNAGTAYVAKLEDLEPEKLDQVIAVNLKGTFTVIKASIPIFRRQGTGGNIVVISTKNVFDPGACFGAYSASKAGAHQISKIAALELAELGVRVNMINPDAIFGDENVCSGLWELVGAERMKSRGLDPEGLQAYYCERSLLKQRVLAEHVGNAVVFFASDLTPTTGAALPVDGGNPAAFPR